jgi:hypothetical protein
MADHNLNEDTEELGIKYQHNSKDYENKSLVRLKRVTEDLIS